MFHRDVVDVVMTASYGSSLLVDLLSLMQRKLTMLLVEKLKVLFK